MELTYLYDISTSRLLCVFIF